MGASTLDEHPLQADAQTTAETAQGTRRGGWQQAGGAGARSAGRRLDWRQVAGALLVLAGLVAVVLAWWGISGTAQTWRQFPYLASGGVGGAALVAVGVTLLVAYEHARDRVTISELLERIDRLEDRLDERLERVEEHVAAWEE